MVNYSSSRNLGGDQSVHSFEWQDIEGKQRSMKEFAGKPLLIVNVATFCGLTGQYLKLNKIKDHFGDRINIVGFPSNHFKMQEPCKNEEILNAIKYVRPGQGYSPNFPLAAKIDVNGKNQHPLYKYLKESCPSPNPAFKDRANLFYDPIHVDDIRWNFEKFLVTAQGQPWRRYEPATDPEELVGEIEELLKA